jgi:hypothetical protein
MKRPSGLTATAFTVRMAFQGVEQAPVKGMLSASHTFTVLIVEPLTMKRPSGLTATAFTQSVWPSRERSRRPSWASHTFTVRYPRAPLTMVRPSGLTATAFTPTRMAFQGAEQAPAGPPTPSPCGRRSR